jgi:hypothetical protein
MAIRVDRTPNPAAMKFTVGQPVGGPATVTDPEGADAWLADILGIDGVASVFMTADFVTLTAAPATDWDVVTPRVVEILEARFG